MPRLSVPWLLSPWLAALSLATPPAFATQAVAAVPARTVLVVGDSISAAYGIQRDEGWVHLLAERVGTRAKVVNVSVSGETTGGGLARLPLALDVHDPDVVLIELGGNDGLRGYPVARIRENLDRMMAAVNDAGAVAVVVGMQIPPNYGPRYTTAFRDIFAEVAAAWKAPFVPFLLEGAAAVEGMMQRDGLHPTAAAQPTLLENVWPILEPLLTAPQPYPCTGSVTC